MVWACPHIVGGVASWHWCVLILWEESPHGIGVSLYCGRSHLVVLVCPYIVGGVTSWRWCAYSELMGEDLRKRLTILVWNKDCRNK